MYYSELRLCQLYVRKGLRVLNPLVIHIVAKSERIMSNNVISGIQLPIVVYYLLHHDVNLSTNEDNRE